MAIVVRPRRYGRRAFRSFLFGCSCFIGLPAAHADDATQATPVDAGKSTASNSSQQKPASSAQKKPTGTSQQIAANTDQSSPARHKPREWHALDGRAGRGFSDEIQHHRRFISQQDA